MKRQSPCHSVPPEWWGTMTDREIGERIGTSGNNVRHFRRAHHIPNLWISQRDSAVGVIGKQSDRTAAAVLGHSEGTIIRWRKQLGIPHVKAHENDRRRQLRARLSTVTHLRAADVARQWGIPASLIGQWRAEDRSPAKVTGRCFCGSTFQCSGSASIRKYCSTECSAAVLLTRHAHFPEGDLIRNNPELRPLFAAIMLLQRFINSRTRRNRKWLQPSRMLSQYRPLEALCL